ncbi:MAG TPA: ATP-binding protein [Armatimonadota bacterium]|nr:ATP-binding protein [Armatimonadota bacterium]
MLRDLLNWGPRKELVELITPRKTFADVILPDKTRQALADTLTQIEKHHLIFETWGLGERHATGTGLAFNFAGPPGTGKTICAEAVANLLEKRLYKVRYNELESCWAGETGKNISSVFREALQQDAVLFFDEADSIASRRFTSMSLGYEREANQAVNILLKELENYDGVVIFATNLCANFDPAFERRIRTHILFEQPGPRERELIWKAQLHPQKTPLADDVDFHALAEQYPATGGDIKNAVLKAAQVAAGEKGADSQKRITQHHFETAIRTVLEAKKVMDQNLFGTPAEQNTAEALLTVLQGIEARVEKLEGKTADTEDRLNTLRSEVNLVLADLSRRVEGLQAEMAASGKAAEERLQTFTTEWNERLRRVTILRLPKWATLLLGALAVGAAAGLTALGMR